MPSHDHDPGLMSAAEVTVVEFNKPGLIFRFGELNQSLPGKAFVKYCKTLGYKTWPCTT